MGNDIILCMALIASFAFVIQFLLSILGTVFDGGQNSTGNFLNNVVKTVAPALGVIDQLPIADTLKKLKGDDKK